MVLTRRAEGTSQLELEHYKLDNERLIKMLAQTDEFANMGFIAEDSGSNIRYMDSERQPQGCHYPKKKSNLKSLKESDEVEDWIP